MEDLLLIRTDDSKQNRENEKSDYNYGSLHNSKNEHNQEQTIILSLYFNCQVGLDFKAFILGCSLNDITCEAKFMRVQGH